MMCGTAILYAARTIMPVCIVEVADTMKWDKTESVSTDDYACFEFLLLLLVLAMVFGH